MRSSRSMYTVSAHDCSKRAGAGYIVCQCLVRGIGLAIPYFTELLIDAVSQQDSMSLWRHTLLVLLAVLAYILCLTLAFYRKSCYEDAWILDKKRRFLEKMTKMPLRALREKGAGFYLQRFTANIEGCRSFILDKPVNFYLNFFYSAGILLSMLRIHVGYALALLAFFPIWTVLYRYLAKKIQGVTREIEEQEEKSNALLEEIYACNYAIRASNAEAWYLRRTGAALTAVFQRKRERNRIEAVYDYCLITGLLNLVSVLVYSVGGLLTLWGKISYGMIISMSLYYSKLWTPLEFYLDYPKQYARYRVHRERMQEVLDEPQEDVPSHGSGLETFRELEVRSLSYAMGETAVLDRLSLVVRQGEHVAVSGGNGSGKTTLANILAAIYEDYSGGIYYNGIEYRQLNPHDIRRHICLIPAEPELFSGTIGENLRMGESRDVPEIVREILEEKQLSMDFLVQEGGANLSSGEAKLVQLLRGICCGGECYIIDEPLNYIDGHYAEVIVDALETLFRSKTAIIISHDQRVFRMCAKRYFLEDGKLMLQLQKGQWWDEKYCLGGERDENADPS